MFQRASFGERCAEKYDIEHLGANLLVFDTANQTFSPTEAAAAWLDDDIATGWPPLTGKQDYLLALPEPALVNNFFISARSTSQT